MNRLLVVGGNGDVGRLVIPHLQSDWQVRVLDPGAASSAPGVEFLRGSVLDYDVVLQATAGCDAVLYLAMGPKDPETWERPEKAALQFEIATTGMYLALRAAAASGAERFVYASSMSVFADFAASPPPEQYGPADATHFYGLAKRLGETLLESTSALLNLDAWALRLCFPIEDADLLCAVDRVIRQTGIAASDLARAVNSALRSDLTGFHVAEVSSDAAGRFVNLAAAKELLDWSPAVVASAPDFESGCA